MDALVSQSASVVCIAVRVSRAAASQQRVLELMHRVSGYTLRVLSVWGDLRLSCSAGGSLRPGRVVAAGDAYHTDSCSQVNG